MMFVEELLLLEGLIRRHLEDPIQHLEDLQITKGRITDHLQHQEVLEFLDHLQVADLLLVEVVALVLQEVVEDVIIIKP